MVNSSGFARYQEYKRKQDEEKKKKEEYRNNPSVKKNESLEYANLSPAQKQKVSYDKYKSAKANESQQKLQRIDQDRDKLTPSMNLSASVDKFEGMKKQADAEKKARAEQMPMLEKKIKDGHTLLPNEEYIYNKGSVEALSEAEQKAMRNIVDGYAQKVRSSEDYERQYAADLINQGANELKKLGWDQNKINDYSQRGERIAHTEWAESMKPTSENGFVNFMYNRATFIPAQIQGAVGDVVAVGKAVMGKNPEGQGRDMYNEWNRLNMQRDINSQYMQQKLGEQYGDAPNNLWGAMSGQNPAQMLFSAAESTGDSLIAMGVGQALAAGLGVAGAGAELEAVKANGGEITSALSKAAQTEKLIQNIGTMPFVQQGYYSGYKEAREAGASEAGAELRGIASGLAEFVTEKVSLDSAWEIARGTKAGRGLLVNLLAQSGIEGSEEMASDLLNDIADGIISKALGDKLSDYDQKTADYMAQGESEESAKGKALLDKVDEYLVDGLMGALSGGLMGGSAVAQGYKASKTNQARDQFYSDSLAKYEGNNEYEVQANEDVDRYKQNPTRFYAESIDDSVEDNKRIKADLMSYADKVDSGLELSVSDRADIENLLGEAQRNNQFSKYKGYSEEIANVPTEYRTAVTNISVEEATAQMNEAAQNGDAEAMGNILHKMQSARSSEVKEAAEETFNRFVGLAENNGADVEAIENARISSQDAYLKGLKGEAIESSSNKSSRVELAYNEGTKAKLINESVTLEDSALKYENPEVAKQYIDNYTNDLSVPQYDQAFNTFATAGKARLNFDNLVNGRYGWLADKIGKDRARKFYDIGLNQADAEAKSKANAGVIRTLNHRKVGSFTDMRSDKSNANYDQILNFAANSLGLNINLWDDNQIRDSKGKIQVGARADYRASAGEINLTVSNVSSIFHELSHFGQDFAPEEYKKFKSSVLESLSNYLGETEFTKMMRTFSNTYEGSTQDEITDELVASAMVGIMTDQKAWNEFGKVLAKNYTSQEAMTIKEKIINFFKNILDSFKSLINDSHMSESERLVYEAKIDNQMDIIEQYSKMLDKAIQEHKNELMQNIVEIDEGDIRLSMATKDASMKALNEYLATSDLTEADKQDIRDHIEWAYGIAKKFTDNKKLVGFNQWQQTGLRTRDNGDGTKTPLLQVYNNGKPVRSVIVNNGEYPLNIDFSQVCKKRIALNDVLNKLVSDASLNIRILNEKDISGINDIIKQHNFEIACGLCFVDAKRYRVGKWANTFVNGDKKKGSYGWNRLVKSLAPRNVGIDYFAVASDHIKPLGTLLTEVDDSQLDFTLVDKVIEPFLKEDGTIGQVIIDGKKANPTEDVKMAYLLRHHPELRKLLDKNDIIASEGLDALRENYLLVYNLLNAHGGTSKPKLSHGFTAYGGDIAKAKNFTPENAYKVGGVRVQSFSDYVANLFFDYMQMFADMTARQLPSHAYTKELDYVKLFGMTGQRINMSVIFKGADLTAEQQKRLRSLKTKAKILADPEFSELASHAGLDADGNYIYEDESIDFEKAKEIRHDSDYKYCGTIGVGLSDPHIRKMLNDSEFDMVIPYHSSGVSDIIKRARNLVLYTDYTSVQNTRGADGKKLDGGDGFAWYDYLKSDANPNGYDAKTVADMYLKHCDENGYLPKFDKFRDEPNYYKLLIDFRAYDNDGNFMPQGAVKMSFPENFESIVKESLIAQQEVDGRRQAELNDAQDSLYREVKNFLKKSKVLEETNVFSDDDSSNIMNSGEDTRYSKEVTDKKKLEFLENQEHIKVYRTFQMIDGGLYAPMNAVENGKLGFRSDLGKWEEATEITDFEKAIADKKIVVDAKGNYKFVLEAGKNTTSGKNRRTPAAYNPYLHSSNLVFNDQFTAAYDRPNLVVVECEVPISETTSGYHAVHAKDPVGWIDWKSGDVANALKKVGIQRKVMLTRWMKPVRILDNSEVADIYRDTLKGTGIVVDWNVVSPPLREELEKRNVAINYGYISALKASFEDKFPDVRYSKDTDSEGNKLTENQVNFFKNSKVRDEDGNLRVVYHGTSENFTVFDRTKTRANMDIQGMFFSPYDIDAEGYGNTKAYYLNITNPADESTAIKALMKFKGQNGAGIKARELLVSQGYDGVYNGYDEYIAFEPNQIKLIDNLNPTENDDIRYSKTVSKEDMTPAQWASFYSAVGNYNDNYGVEDYELTPEGYVIIPITTVEKGKQKNIVVLSDGKLISPSVEKIVYLNAINDADNGNILKTVVLGEKDGDYQKAKHILEKVFGHGIISEVYGQDNRYYGEPNLERERRDSRSTIRFSKELQEQGRNGSGSTQGEFADERRPLEDIDDLLDDDMFESLFNDGFIDELEDELDVKKPINWNWMNELMDSLEESIKASESGTKRERKKAQRHLTKAVVGKEFVTNGKKVAFKDERIDKYLDRFAASNKDYAQAYITYMSPAQFLLLTANGDKGSKTFEWIKEGSHPFNEAEFLEETQPIFLDLDEKKNGKGEIVGHEGRHRMFAFGKAGFSQIPVLVFNYRNKYDKHHIDSITLTPQSYNYETKYNKSNLITLTDLEPLSTGNRDTIIAKFGSGAEADVRYSKEMDDEYMKAVNSGDMETAQKMVDDAARLMGYNVKAYHGTQKGDFTIFETKKLNSNMGSHFGSLEIADRFARDWKDNLVEGSRIYSVYLRAEHPFETYDWFAQDDMYPAMEACDLADAIGTPKALALKEKILDLDPAFRETYEDRDLIDETYLDDNEKENILWGSFRELLDLGGYDSIKYENMLEVIGDIDYIIQRPEQIKLADPVTYDDNGNVIPLSQRFDFTERDIRYSKEMKPLDLAARVYDFASDFDYYQTYDAVGEEGMNEIDAIAESISKGEVGYFIDTIEDILYDDDLDMLPETRTNGEQILNALKSFGGTRYSLVERDDYITEDYEAPVEESILKEGLKALKNHPVNKSAVKKIAIDLINENHSTMSVSKLTNDISKAFAYLSTQEHMTYKDAARIMEEIAKPMLEASNDIEGDEEYNNFISAVGKVRLTDNQMKEVKKMFGSYGEFKAMVSPLQINMNATVSLDDVWESIVDNSYGNLDYDTTENDQAFALYDAIRSLRPSIVNKFGGDLDEVSKEVGIRIIEEYLRNEGKEDTAKILKQGREEYRNKIKSQYDARLKRAREELAVDRRWQKNLAKRDYEERLKQDKEALKQKNAEYRQKLNEKFDEKAKRVKLEADVDRMWQKNLAHQDYLDRVAELRARNKQLSQQKAETIRANKVKKSIEQNVVKLQKWIANPSEEHHVPMDMVEPILEFMTALDFIEPEIKTDGKTFYVTIFDHMEYHNGKKSPQYIRIEGKTKAEVRDKFYAQLDRGIGSARQRTWVDRMRAIKDLYDEAVKGNNFTNSDVTDFASQLDGSLVDELSELIKNANGKIYVNDFDSKQLTVVDKVIKNIIQVVNRGNKAAAQNEDIKLLSEDTIGRSKGKVMSDSSVRKWFVLDMATPLSYFDNMGDGASKIYRGLRNGFNTKIRDIRTASEFMKNLIPAKKAKNWTGNNPDYKSFNIGDRKIDLTVAQIMSLYELVKRDQTLGHLKGGFTPTTFKTGKFNKVTHNLDERPVHLTNEEIVRITDTLTDEQKRVADEMQHFLADTCSGWGNEVSRNLYGYEKFLDPNYFPITSDKNYLMSNNENTAFDSLNGIERSGFTKQVIKNASNPIVIADIFDVFTKHVNDMATYHGFAAPIKDANRWFNYKTVESLDEDVRNYSSVKDAISRLSGQGGQQYYIKLIKDLNGMEKSQYIAAFTDKVISGYKSAAVGANIRVVIQQPTAYFRAANIIDPKYLASALVSPREARRIGKMMREQSEIAWWKSQGYFETSIGRSMKNIITGQESVSEKVKDTLMAPAGVADDLTWGVLYTAVAKEQSALGLKGDELEKAIKERFDEVVDQTQVVDSTLHRSQLMRSQDMLNKLQTAFMAEPIKSYNMLMRAAMTKDKNKITRAAMTFVVTNVITAAAASLVDAFRRDDDDKDWGEEYVKAFEEGVIDNVNPLNLMPIIKDVSNTFIGFIMGTESYQTQSNRMDLDAVNSLFKSSAEIIKYAKGDSNKTRYGIIMTALRPLSQLTGIPLYNLTRDASALYNAFFPDLKKTISTNQYAEVYDLIKQGKDVDRIEEAVKKVVEKGGSLSDIKSGISSRYKSDYFDMYQVDPNEAQKLGEKAARGYAAIGMDDEEIEGIIDSWKEESITYPKLYKAIMSGEGIEEQIDKLREAGKADDKIAEKVADKFFDTIVYADENEISSPVKENTDKAIKYITGMDFDSYIEAEEKAAIEAEAEKAAKAKATAEKKAKAAENKAIKQEKTGHKQNLYNNIDNGGDYKTNVEKIHQDGTDYDQIKSLLTKEYKGKNLTQQQKSRIATIKAYCDEKSGTKIAKKYNGNYYQYELDEINKW